MNRIVIKVALYHFSVRELLPEILSGIFAKLTQGGFNSFFDYEMDTIDYLTKTILTIAMQTEITRRVVKI